jgi:hypothetical protein
MQKQKRPVVRGLGGAIPNGQVIAELPSYGEAVAYVEQLLRGDFAATAIAIVGSDLTTVERVRARISYARVAINGAMIGGFVGLILSFFNESASTGTGTGTGASTTTALSSQQTSAATIILGAGVGMAIQMLRFALTKNKRGFLSASMVVAKKYDIMVPSALASAAAEAYSKGAEATS